jgi:hypothetical protein
MVLFRVCRRVFCVIVLPKPSQDTTGYLVDTVSSQVVSEGVLSPVPVVTQRDYVEYKLKTSGNSSPSSFQIVRKHFSPWRQLDTTPLGGD